MPSSSTNAKWNIDWNHPKLKDRDGLILLYKMANEQGQPDIAKEAMQRAAELDKKTAPYRPGLPWEGGIGLGKPWNIVDTVKPSAPVAPRPNINAQIHAQAMATPPVTANNEASDILAEFRALLAKSQESTGPSATQSGGDLWAGWSKPQSVGGVGTINMNQPVQNNGAFVSQNLPVFGGVGQSGWMSSTGIGGRTTADIRSNPKYQAIANQLRGTSDAGLVFGGLAETPQGNKTNIEKMMDKKATIQKQLANPKINGTRRRSLENALKNLDVSMKSDPNYQLYQSKLENTESLIGAREASQDLATKKYELNVTKEKNKNLWKLFNTRQAQEGARRVSALLAEVDLEANPGMAKAIDGLLDDLYKGRVDVPSAEKIANKIASDNREEQRRKEDLAAGRVTQAQEFTLSRDNTNRVNKLKSEFEKYRSQADKLRQVLAGVSDTESSMITIGGKEYTSSYLRGQFEAAANRASQIKKEIESLSSYDASSSVPPAPPVGTPSGTRIRSKTTGTMFVWDGSSWTKE
jgi:hypothetical protein